MYEIIHFLMGTKDSAFQNFFGIEWIFHIFYITNLLNQGGIYFDLDMSFRLNTSQIIV